MKRGGRYAGLALALSVSACAHATIPNTTIEDTEENREVLALVAHYEQAVESLDPDAVLALVSPKYYENNGNTDATDDYDYEGLKTRLHEGFELTKTLQLMLRVDAVEVEDDAAWAQIYYEYRAHNEYPSGMKWDTRTDTSRLQLERGPNGRWLIVSGL